MTKSDIVKEIHSRTGIRNQTCALIIDELIDTIKSNMTNGHNIYLRGFGTFIVRHHNAKRAYNINNDSYTVIQAHCTPVFKPGKELVSKTR